jgi:hypothetical protein
MFVFSRADLMGAFAGDIHIRFLSPMVIARAFSGVDDDGRYACGI